MLLPRARRMQPIVDHIQITVRDMSVAVPFYDKLLPLLGFSPQSKTSAVIDAHEFHVVEYSHPRMAFAITSPRRGFQNETIHRRKPGALHHRRAAPRISRIHTARLLRAVFQGPRGHQLRDRYSFESNRQRRRRLTRVPNGPSSPTGGTAPAVAFALALAALVLFRPGPLKGGLRAMKPRSFARGVSRL